MGDSFQDICFSSFSSLNQMKIAVLTLAIMVMSCFSASFSDKKAQGDPKGKKCKAPKGNPGSVRKAGCIQSTCKMGKWIPTMRTDICCFKNKDYKPNTEIVTIVGEHNTTTTISCQKGGELSFTQSTGQVGLLAEQIVNLKDQSAQQFRDIKRLMEKHIEETATATPCITPTTPTTITTTKDLLYLDSTMIVELPSFTPFTSCAVESYPVPVTYAVTALIEERILICGGSARQASGYYAYQSACYSLTDGSWTQETGMMEKREWAASSIWPGHGLLVTGGYNHNPGESGKKWSSTEYLSSSKQWTPGPVLPVGMYGHCQVTAGSDVIIAGGRSDGGYLASAYKMSEDGRSWSQLPSMTRARYGHACAVHQGYIYVMGGRPAHASVERMKLTSLTWETGPELDTALSFFIGQSTVGEAIVYQDTLFLVYKQTGRVVKLNTEDKWEDVADLGGDIGNRPVFPAPIVTPATIGC